MAEATAHEKNANVLAETGAGAVAVLLGFALVTVYTTGLSLLGAYEPMPGGAGLLASAVRMLSRAAVCLVVALLPARLAPLGAHRGLLWGCAALCAVAAGIAGIQAGFGLQLGNVVFVISTLARAAALILMFAWLELYARMDISHVVVLYVLVHLCSAAISFAIDRIPSAEVSAVVLAVVPLVATALFERGRSIVAEAPYAQGEPVAGDWSFPLRPVVLFAAFAFCNYLVRSTLPASDHGLATAGVVVACLVALAVIARNGSGRTDLWGFYLAAFPLALAGLLGLLFDGGGFGVAASLLTNAGYALFNVFITVALCGISFRYGVSALMLFGFAHAGGYLASSLGLFAASSMTGMTGNEATGVVVAAAVALALCFVFVVRDVGRDATWGVSQGSSAEGEPRRAESPEEHRRAVCASLAREFGLTRREEDVLVLLARDLTANDIERELVLSNATVKSHTQAVYRKLGVHSRRDVVDLVGAR